MEVLRRFGRRPWPGVALTVVTPAQHTPYTGMLPGLVAAVVIVSAGARYTVATRNGVSAEGVWAWRLKDRIDHRYMARFA